MNLSREQLALGCFACATVASAHLTEHSLNRDFVQIYLSIGFATYCQNPEKHPHLTRLLKAITWFAAAYLIIEFLTTGYAELSKL